MGDVNYLLCCAGILAFGIIYRFFSSPASMRSPPWTRHGTATWRRLADFIIALAVTAAVLWVLGSAALYLLLWFLIRFFPFPYAFG